MSGPELLQVKDSHFPSDLFIYLYLNVPSTLPGVSGIVGVGVLDVTSTCSFRCYW